MVDYSKLTIEDNNPQPRQASQILAQISESQEKTHNIVIDANVLIKQINLRNILPYQDSFEKSYKIFTTNEVIAEIKDAQTKQYLQNLPFELKVQDQASYVSKDNLVLTRNFARDTGDFKSLSQTDINLIAFGVQICENNNEKQKIKDAPLNLEEFRPKQFIEFYQKIDEDENENQEEDASN